MENLKCTDIRSLQVDFIDNTISDKLKIQVEKHLETCAACQDEFIQTGELIELMKKEEDQLPSSNLSKNFYDLLEDEKIKQNQNIHIKESSKTSFKISTLKYAAQIIVLLGIGYLIGNTITLKNSKPSEIAMLKEEIKLIQNNLSLSSLSQPTANQRLNAIQNINNSSELDADIANVLINTLNHDENVNVRMAAAYALAKYSVNETVKNALINSLDQQKDPLLQITLIGILTDIQDSRAKQPFEKILNNENTPAYVKDQAKQAMKVFI